jgi:hypothetical protein
LEAEDEIAVGEGPESVVGPEEDKSYDAKTASDSGPRRVTTGGKEGMQRNHADDFGRKLGRPSPTRNRRIVNFSSHSTKTGNCAAPEQDEPNCGSLDFRIPACRAQKKESGLIRTLLASRHLKTQSKLGVMYCRGIFAPSLPN